MITEQVASLTQAGFALLLAAPVMLGTAGVVGRVLRWAPVAWLGVVSYGIYLWHYDLLLDLRPELWDGGRVRAAAGVVLVLALSVAAGALSYVLLERPALALARRGGGDPGGRRGPPGPVPTRAAGRVVVVPDVAGPVRVPEDGPDRAASP